MGNDSNLEESLPLGTLTVSPAVTTPGDTMAGRTDWRQGWGGFPKFYACGCSTKVFGEMREYHAVSCPDRRAGIGRDVLIPVDRQREWSRLRDPRRIQRQQYFRNKRKFDRISSDPHSSLYGKWGEWTDSTQVSTIVK